MTPHKLLVLAVAALLIVASAGCRTGGSSDPTIVLYGFSAMEEVMKNEIIPGFQRHWRSKSGQDVRFVTSFAGSGTITNQIIFGAPAQVALVATEMDALSIKRAGFASTDWRTFTNQSLSQKWKLRIGGADRSQRVR